MALTKKAVGCVLGGLVGLVLTVSNPFFEARDIVAPLNVVEKAHYRGSPIGLMGLGYALTYSLAGSCVIGLAYLGLTGNLVARRREERDCSERE